jgi:hypothetical protein
MAMQTAKTARNAARLSGQRAAGVRGLRHPNRLILMCDFFKVLDSLM